MPYDINEVLLLLSALYFFWIYVLSPHGETHHSDRTEFDHENHEIQKVMSEGPRPTKWALNRPKSRTTGLLYGLPSPSLHHLTPSFVLGQVRAQYTLFLYILLSILNRIENPLINNFKI